MTSRSASTVRLRAGSTPPRQPAQWSDWQDVSDPKPRKVTGKDGKPITVTEGVRWRREPK